MKRMILSLPFHTADGFPGLALFLIGIIITLFLLMRRKLKEKPNNEKSGEN